MIGLPTFSLPFEKWEELSEFEGDMNSNSLHWNWDPEFFILPKSAPNELM